MRALILHAKPAKMNTSHIVPRQTCAYTCLMKTIRPLVLFMPMTLLVAAVVASFIDMDGFLKLATRTNGWILDTFSTVFSTAVFGFVLTCIWVFFSPIGKVRIGGESATPLLSRWSWFSITMCTTIAIGILFWGTAEPMYHLYDVGTRDIIPQSPEAVRFSLVSLFMHWAFSPYAIYTVPALCFALVYHNMDKPYSMSGPINVLTGRDMPNRASEGLDAIILLSLILGMAANLGACMLLLSGGITKMTGAASSTFLLAGIAFAIVVVVLLSSLSGLNKGIRILSDWNAKIFFAFLAFVFICGPTLYILREGAGAVLGYALEFIPRSFVIGDASDRDWANAWTIFYWANWLAWAPVTAMFLGRIAKGYTVRAFIGVNFIAPALFAIVWMSVFGGFALSVNASTNGTLKTALDTGGPEAVLFEALTALPMGVLLIPLLVALSFLSYVTAADSNTEAIAMICEKPDVTPSPKTRPTLKIIWVSLLVSTAWIMTAYSGIDGVRMLSNLGGLPALFVVIALNFTLIKLSLKPSLLTKT